MPSSLNSGPFLSLRPDHDCGRSKVSSPKSFSSLSGTATPTTNGNSNGYSHTNGHGSLNSHTNGNGHSLHNDEFLRLDAPQQDLLLLHGPRQKYKLEKSKDIPELQGEREILVQVLAIGLNPVDWKGADYGFSQPSYPWVNGRDFAGIVVRTARTDSHIKQGDVVFGPSTDYRDVRKAAYQEYVVTTDYNVSRIPQGVDVKEGAALGVAWVAAVVSLGISFGVDFSSLRNAPQGPDLVQLVRGLDPREVPEDIRDEIFSGIPTSERPQPGEWIAIWGANSMTGQVALQLAKHAGLKVACIADIARGGTRLSELGADFMVDKYDDKRAVDILKAVTGGKLRFGFDCNGKESATSLQDALSQSDSGLKSHLLGLAGLPKSVGRGVVHHKVPIKIFHEAPSVGEAISLWLEKLLVEKSLRLPEVEVAQGGLAGINDALDRMRTGTIGGKRIVVAVGNESKDSTPSPSNGVVPNGIASKSFDHTSADFSYADSLNSDPDRVRFAYWVPNVSGGLVISKIAQRTYWDHKSNIKYAQTAERVGFEFALSQIRFMAGYGADNQHEPLTLSQALLMKTERLKLIVALLPGPWNPAIAAKACASLDIISDGRVAVNVVSGWFKLEFTSIGQWWLDHAERYRRSKEFIQCLKGIWTQDSFTFKGDFYQFHDYPLKPKPLNLPGRPYPEIFQGGNSDDAKENAGSASDYYFMNGNTLEGFRAQIHDVKDRAKKNNREGEVGFALNAFVICRETEEEALRVLAEIQGKANHEAVEGFRQQVANAGSSTKNKSGMWANSSMEDLVQYNDGFKTKLIGTKEQIAERIVMLKSLGVNIILTAFLHYEEEVEAFGREVLPLVRELERQGRGKDEEDEVRRTGWIYEAKNRREAKSIAQNMNSSTSEFSTSPNIAVVAAAAAPTSSTPAAHKRPFATLMPNSSPCVVSPTEKMGYAKNEPHRAFPPTYRNPTLMPSSPLNVAAKEKRGSANELHRPFPSTHRNPSFMPSSSLDIAVVKKREVIDGPHRAFPPTHRNPSALPASLVEIAAEEKQGFMDEAHRAFPPTYRNPSVMPSPSLLDIAAEEKKGFRDEAYRPFPPTYRNPSLMPTSSLNIAAEEKQGSANEPHRPFPSTHRNAEGEEVPLSQMSSLYESKSFSPSQTALDLGVVEGEAHRPFSPTYRNPSDVGDVAAAVDEGKDKEEVGGEQQPHRAFEAGYRNPDPRVGIEKVQVHRSFTVLHGKSKGGREQQGRLEVGESVAQLKEEVSVGGVEERRSEMGRGDGHRPFEVHFRNPPLDEDLSSTGVVAAAASLVQQGQEKDESQGYVGDVLPSMASVGRVQDQPETGIAAYPSLSVDLREREPLDAAASLSTTGFVPGVSSSQVKPAEDAESDLQGSSSATSGLLISQSTSGVQHSEPFKSPEPEQQDSEQGNQPAQSPIALHPHTLKTPSSAAPPIQQAHTPSSAAAATLPNIKIISNNPSIVSPAGSEKSFATAEGGSSSSVVHVRLSDAGQEAENGKPLELQREERDVEPAREEIVTPLRRSGSVRRGFAVGSKRNKAGMFKGLRNSLRRGRE